MDDTVRRFLADQDALRRHADALRTVQDQVAPAVNALRSLTQTPAMLQIIEDARRRQKMVRAALGPMEDIRRLGLFDQTALAAARSAYQDFHNQFHLPAIEEAQRLFKQYEDSPALSAIRRIHEDTEGVRRALEAMRTPWLDVQNQLRSIGGFAESKGNATTTRRMVLVAKRHEPDTAAKRCRARRLSIPLPA